MPKSSPPQPALFPLAIVVSRYNSSITDKLLRAAVAEYASAGGSPNHLTVIDAPGSFELPALCLHAARSGKFAGILALGCIIKGDTPHDQYIAHAVAQGLTHITLHTGVPIAFGLLTTNTVQQAKDRAGGKKGNKGHEAMAALIDTVFAIQSLASNSAHKPNRSSTRPDKATKR
jgi:6,7-dimethyl-8-ribityllumazine synthase